MHGVLRLLRRLLKVLGIGVLVIVVIVVGALGVVWFLGPPVAKAGDAVVPPIDCRATPERPHPVVVLPGGDGTVDQTDAQWRTTTDALRGAGYCTLVFQVRGSDGNRWAADVPTAGRDLNAFVDLVLVRTGAQQVAIVAHSAGSVVANHFLKVEHGAPKVADAVFLAPETSHCDGRGFAESMGLPTSPFPLFRAVPAVPALLARLMPSAAGPLQLAPGSPVFDAIFDGVLAQPGVRYSVMATKRDVVATPAGTCSFIEEPGVTNVFYEDAFPAAPAVDHGSLRSSPQVAGWVIGRLAAP
ncbi:hypothetical protein AXK61_05070 [Tsukamurella pseudospumae]|uniref:AB hydrolase-1 domain-containing protein n=1 Tax=Tsukamurella pseudospumae TaxID=239498 RepID=A0A137Z6U6_9ACTN|nr:hypothetical protein AXK61_05070 [Tsukamurella pseudospumae]